MLFTKSEQKIWLNLSAPLPRYSNRYYCYVSAKTNILSRSVLAQVTHASFVNIWFGLYGDTQLRCISRIRNVQFTMPPIFLTICLTTRHRVFFRNTGALQLFDIFEVFFNTHLLFFLFFKVWDSKFYVHWISARPGRLIKRNFSKISMRSQLSKFSIRLSIRLIKVCVQFHCTRDLLGRTGQVLA